MPQPTVRHAITSVLLADTELTDMLSEPEAVYHRVAEQSAVTPFVILQKQSGIPRYSLGGGPNNFYEDELWTVKAVDIALTAEIAEAIDVRLRALLHDAPLDVEGTDTLWCRREQDVDYGEIEEGTIVHHVGAMYRVLRDHQR